MAACHVHPWWRHALAMKTSALVRTWTVKSQTGRPGPSAFLTQPRRRATALWSPQRPTVAPRVHHRYHRPGRPSVVSTVSQRSGENGAPVLLCVAVGCSRAPAASLLRHRMAAPLAIRCQKVGRATTPRAPRSVHHVGLAQRAHAMTVTCATTWTTPAHAQRGRSCVTLTQRGTT